MTSTRHRFLRLAVACVYLAGYLLTFLHFVEERHAVCVEHGAHHHIAESHHHVLSGADDVPRLHEGAPVADDHCSLLQFFRSSSFTLNSPVYGEQERGAAIDETVDDFRRTSHTQADNRRWRFAPKTSPPTTA